MKFKTAGFTLLEIVLVMGIISILMSGGFFVYLRIIERSRINQAVADIQEIRQAIEEYHADMGVYPPRGTCPGQDPALTSITYRDCSNVQITIPNSTNWRGPYLSEFPAETPWGGEYDYENWNNADLNWHRILGYVGNSMSRGIYIGIRPASGGGFGIQSDSPSQQAEEFFRRQGQDSDGIPGPNGVVFYLIKRT